MEALISNLFFIDSNGLTIRHKYIPLANKVNFGKAPKRTWWLAPHCMSKSSITIKDSSRKKKKRKQFPL